MQISLSCPNSPSILFKLTHYPIFQFSFIADPGTGHAEDIALRMAEVCLAASAIMPKAESI